MSVTSFLFFFFKRRRENKISAFLVGSERCIGDSVCFVRSCVQMHVGLCVCVCVCVCVCACVCCLLYTSYRGGGLLCLDLCWRPNIKKKKTQEDEHQTQNDMNTHQHNM